MSIQRRALFIDDESKQVIFSDDLNEAADALEETENYDEEKIQPVIHDSEANWLPALGYSAKFDGHTYIAGATESGKSYFIKMMVINDRYKRQTVLFTNLANYDESFVGIEDLIKFDPSTKYNWEWVLQNQRNKIFIFDDITNNKMLENYKNKMLLEGRHTNTVVICVNHNLLDYMITRQALTDCRYMVTFPSSNRGKIRKFLKDEYGLDKQQLKDLWSYTKNSRYLIIHRFAPNALASKDSIFKL